MSGDGGCKGSVESQGRSIQAKHVQQTFIDVTLFTVDLFSTLMKTMNTSYICTPKGRIQTYQI